jgi:hypothetical protein
MERPTLLPFLLSFALLLGCTTVQRTSIEQENSNPLTASRYGDELADTMANLIIMNDPLVKEPGMQERIQKEITHGKEIAIAARDKAAEGMQAAIISMKEAVSGYALYVDDTLYFSSDFTTKPGPALHVYLTTVVDPRDVTFPDPTALDLGSLQTTYGQQRYAVPSQKKPELLRTVVLWDTTLNRLYGFGQLSKRG